LADGLKLSINTPERNFYHGEIKELKTNSLNGSIEILSKHIPMITVLKPSVTIFIDVEGKTNKAFTSQGILKVEGNEVRILCDAAEWPEEIDEQRAIASKTRAEERLKNKEGTDIKRAESALYRALVRLRTKEL
jgi:F-type H+-transporting ATPase subunit epsilon